jgi:16S rRNA (cytosine967-C5)-methyltransferase
LHNYRLRLQAAGYHAENIFVADVAAGTPQQLPLFDNIILDVPCTGSGTWARTPEYLVFFKKEKIAEYAERQLNILRHAFPKLKPGGSLYYITCSVYQAENEDNIALFLQEQEAEIAVQQYLKGYERGSENIFLCRLIQRGA